MPNRHELPDTERGAVYQAPNIQTKLDFGGEVDRVAKRRNNYLPDYFGLGIATFDGGVLLDVQFLHISTGASSPGSFYAISDTLTGGDDAERIGAGEPGVYRLGHSHVGAALRWFKPFMEDDLTTHPNIEALQDLDTLKAGYQPYARVPVFVVTDRVDSSPVDAGDVYLRLHLLSKLLQKPHTVNLDGAFGKLQRCAWTNVGVIPAESLDAVRIDTLCSGREFVVRHVDKFPLLVDYVQPAENVRIVNGASARLGAHLAPGTVLMKGAYVNFNAGTLGPCMIEGRVSAGVEVGTNSDVGGGASTLGTLSGGNDQIVSMGEHCLIEANAGLGLPIGDRVRVVAGHYPKMTSRIRVNPFDEGWKKASAHTRGLMHTLQQRGAHKSGIRTDLFVKGEELASIDDAIFRRNDEDGISEVVPRGDRIWGKLNAELHT